MRALLIAPVLLALAAWLVYANLLPGRMLPVEDTEISRVQDELRERLATEIDWHYPGTTLHKLPDLFQQRLGVPIKIDQLALADAGWDVDLEMPADMERQPADAILSKMLETYGCAWVIERDYILITTKEMQSQSMASRVYPVRDLVLCRDEEGDVVEDVDSLVDSLESTVQPDTWKNTGMGEGTMEYLPVAGALIVSQTEAVHAELARMIDALRRARKSQRQLPPLKTPTQIPGPKQQPFVGSPVPIVG